MTKYEHIRCLFCVIVKHKHTMNMSATEIDTIIKEIEASNECKYEIHFENNSHAQVVDLLQRGFFADIIRKSRDDEDIEDIEDDEDDEYNEEYDEYNEEDEMIRTLLFKSLEVIWEDTSRAITLKNIAIQFFNEYKKM